MPDVGFIAYPEASNIVTEAISGAVELSKGKLFTLRAWPTMRIVGFKMDDRVRQSIAEASALIADVTYPNMNVYYEIGYAMAAEKPVIPTVNTAVAKAMQQIYQLGLFDTVGLATYTNAETLYAHLQEKPESTWTSHYTRRKNHGQPLYILDTLVKTDFRNHIFHAVENSRVKFRSFDPTESPRLTAA